MVTPFYGLCHALRQLSLRYDVKYELVEGTALVDIKTPQSQGYTYHLVWRFLDPGKKLVFFVEKEYDHSCLFLQTPPTSLDVCVWMLVCDLIKYHLYEYVMFYQSNLIT